jgi:hypothetical protein
MLALIDGYSSVAGKHRGDPSIALQKLHRLEWTLPQLEKQRLIGQSASMGLSVDVN